MFARLTILALALVAAAQVMATYTATVQHLGHRMCRSDAHYQVTVWREVYYRYGGEACGRTIRIGSHGDYIDAAIVGTGPSYQVGANHAVLRWLHRRNGGYGIGASVTLE